MIMKKLFTYILLILITSQAHSDNLIFHQGSGNNEISNVSPINSPWLTDQVTWTPVANAGLPFGRAGSGVIGDYFYVFGSLLNPQGEAYNWNTEHWQLSTPPIFGNCNYCGITVDDEIYLIGWYAYYQIGGGMQKFTPTIPPSGEWTAVSSYPIDVCGIGGAWDGGNYIYACGGGDMTDVFDNAYKYNISGDNWTPIADLPVPMMYHGGAFIDGNFHIMGGVMEDGTAHFAYNSATDTWSEKSDMPIPNYFASFSVTQNDDYIISCGGGGGYHIWSATDAVQLYNPATDSWIQESPLPVAYGMNSAGTMPNGSVISGGGFYNGYRQSTFRGEGFPGSSASFIPDRKEITDYFPVVACINSCYPNPFNSTAKISFSITKEDYYSLSVYNLEGNLVERIFEGELPAGEYQSDFSADNLAAGIYFIRLSSNNFSQVYKLLFTK